MNSLIYKGLKFIVSIQKQEFITYRGSKLIVSIQKHEFIILQRIEGMCMKIPLDFNGLNLDINKQHTLRLTVQQNSTFWS